MRRIAIINQKGGAAKTTTTVSLGAALAEQGRRVLIIDLDPQASTSIWLAIPPVRRGVFEIFAESETTDLASLVQPTGTENLSLVASSTWLIGAEKVLANVTGAEYVLREKLAALEGRYDYLLIDCQPSLAALSVNAMTAADELLVPVAAQVMNLQGLAQLEQSLEVVRKRLNPAVFISGVLACRVDQRTNHSTEVVAALRERFPQTFRTVIRENTKLGECPSHGQSILSYAPKSNGAKDYRSLATEVLNQAIPTEKQKLVNQQQGAYAEAANS